MNRETGHNRRRRVRLPQIAIAVLVFAVTTARGEDGYRLWLRYDPLPRDFLSSYRARVTAIVTSGHSPTLDAIRAELTKGLSGLLDQNVPVISEVDRNGSILVGTPKSSPEIATLKLERQLDRLGPEGFII